MLQSHDTRLTASYTPGSLRDPVEPVSPIAWYRDLKRKEHEMRQVDNVLETWIFAGMQSN